MNYRLGFAGSPQLAVPILRALIEADRSPEIVLTQPAKPTGRGQSITKTPIHVYAEQVGLQVLTPSVLRNLAHKLPPLDILIVAAYGKILPTSLLKYPNFGCINVHFSLLPRWRGATPIEHAILYGDQETGISIMQIVPQLDAGPIYAQQSIPLIGDETTKSLTRTLAELGASLILTVLAEFHTDRYRTPTPQVIEGVTYAPRLLKQSACINWNQSAEAVSRQIRAFHDHNPAFCTRNSLRMKILAAHATTGSFIPGKLYRRKSDLVIGCQSGGLIVNTVQLNRGKGNRMSIQALLNGYGQLFVDGFQFD